MMREFTGCEKLPDETLLAQTKALAGRERAGVEKMLRRLAEVDRRRLYEGQGYPSLFAYCVRELRLCEPEAGRRVAACRAARKYPRAFRMLRKGTLHVRTLTLLAPHLCQANHRSLLAQAAGKSTRAVDRLLASLQGRPERLDRIRHLGPAPRPVTDRRGRDHAGPALPLEALEPKDPEGGPAAREPAALEQRGIRAAFFDGIGNAASAGREAGQGCAPEIVPAPRAAERQRRIEILFTANEELLAKLERAKELLLHRLPGARLEHVLRAVLDDWLDKRDPERVLARKADRVRRRESPEGTESTMVHEGAAARHPARRATVPPDLGSGVVSAARAGSRSRRIPQSVKDAVYRRDGGRCTFVSPAGRRCETRARLEFDHIVPFALGGISKDAANIRLRCRAHNRHSARQTFGSGFVDAAIAAKRAGRRRRAASTGFSPGSPARGP
ncbi:MAG: hypothetical protein ABII00_07730 [Elusimicrobiota bacterium]